MILKKLILLTLILLISAPFIAILLNRVPLTAAPGLGSRIKSYFTENDRSTEQVNQYPELRAPHLALASGQALNAVRQAVQTLGWEVVEYNLQQLTLKAQVTTPLLRFRDDISIGLETTSNQKTIVHIRSKSQLGRGDFGANSRHIIDLAQALNDNSSE